MKFEVLFCVIVNPPVHAIVSSNLSLYRVGLSMAHSKEISNTIYGFISRENSYTAVSCLYVCVAVG